MNEKKTSALFCSLQIAFIFYILYNRFYTSMRKVLENAI